MRVQIVQAVQNVPIVEESEQLRTISRGSTIEQLTMNGLNETNG